jgi:hypothetical protein
VLIDAVASDAPVHLCSFRVSMLLVGNDVALGASVQQGHLVRTAAQQMNASSSTSGRVCFWKPCPAPQMVV